MRRTLCTVSTLLLAAACGGGGSSGGPSAPPPPPPPPPPPSNNAPEFTSASSVSIEENTTGVLFTFEATDADSDDISFAFTGPGDSQLFDLNSDTGELSARSPIDFERPDDADGDNVYEIDVEASDGQGGTTSTTLSLTVTDVAENGTIVTISGTFFEPVFVAPIPGTELLAVVEKAGEVYAYNPATGALASPLFLNLAGDLSYFGEQGLLGLAFSPDYETDGTIYINVTNTSGDTEIRRYTAFSGSRTQIDPSTKDVILRVAQPASNHNAGWIGFSNDGLLYVPLGDGGGSGDPNENAQDPDELLGKILRIDVTGDDFPGDDLRDYTIPAGNAFEGGGGRPEIFALGVRNPYRGSVDPVTGDLFFGDVGQDAIEEINRLPADAAGTNFGWDTREGTQTFEGPDDAAFTPPVAEYAHGTGPFEGSSVVGGYVYRGNIEAIQDHYVFGDFITGNFWSVPESDLVIGQTVPSSAFQRLNDVFEGANLIGGMSSFGLDKEGRLLIQNYSGNLNRLEDQL